MTTTDVAEIHKELPRPRGVDEETAEAICIVLLYGFFQPGSNRVFAGKRRISRTGLWKLVRSKVKVSDGKQAFRAALDWLVKHRVIEGGQHDGYRLLRPKRVNEAAKALIDAAHDISFQP